MFTPEEQLWPAAYTKRDKPGRKYWCGCAPSGGDHLACANCLILVGPRHLVQELVPWRLPVMRERFDAAEGVWLRELLLVPGQVCGWCVDEFSRPQPLPPTMRLDIKSPDERLRVAQAWADAHPEVAITRRYLGGYARVERLVPHE